MARQQLEFYRAILELERHWAEERKVLMDRITSVIHPHAFEASPPAPALGIQQSGGGNGVQDATMIPLARGGVDEAIEGVRLGLKPNGDGEGWIDRDGNLWKSPSDFKLATEYAKRNGVSVEEAYRALSGGAQEE